MKRGLSLFFMGLLVLSLSGVSAGAFDWLFGSPSFSPDEGLVAYYNFEDNFENAVTGNDAVLEGNPLIIEDFSRGKVLILDGQSYLNIPEDFDLPLDELSIAAWYFLNDSSRVSNRVNKQYSIVGHLGSYWANPLYLYLRTDSNKEISFGSDDYYRAGNVETGVWSHVVGVYDGTYFKIYQDGSLVGKADDSNFKIRSLKDLTIGYMPTLNSPKYFNGMLDEVRIYDKALNEEDVAVLYEMSTSPIEPEDLVIICTDSDGGLNYEEKGEALSGDSRTRDMCRGDDGTLYYDSTTQTDIISEAICKSDGTMEAQDYDCSSEGKICQDGACVELPEVLGCCVNYQEGFCYSEYASEDCFLMENADWLVNDTQCVSEESDYYCNEGCCILWDETEFVSERRCDRLSEWKGEREEFDLDLSKEGCLALEINLSKLNLEILDSCSDVTDFLKNPEDFYLENDKWKLSYADNYTWEDRAFYYSSFTLNSRDDYSHLDIHVSEFNNALEEEILSELENSLSYDLCTQKSINGQNVYICINPWDVYREKVNLADIDSSYKSKIAFWISGNKFFRINTYSSDYYWNCWDEDSCEDREREIHNQKQENIIDYLEDLYDNDFDYISQFYLDWNVEKVISNLINHCKSDLDFSEENKCSSSWSCKLEPVICPPHGFQTQTCNQYCNGEDNAVVSEIECNPGICSGCYVPKWFGNVRENNCIPYGFRFEQQFDSFEEQYYDEDYELISVAEFNRDFSGEDFITAEVTGEDELILKVNREFLEGESVEYSVTIAPDVIEGDYDIYNLSAGDKADISFKEFAGAKEETLSIAIGEINFDGEFPEKSIVGIIVGYSGVRNVPVIMNAYCDIDGRVKEQRTKNSKGNWANCQNNYECASNVCSSGECIEVVDMIANANIFKRVAIKFWCRFTNIFSSNEYNQCVYDLIGEGESNDSGVSSGGSGGGGGSSSEVAVNKN